MAGRAGNASFKDKMARAIGTDYGTATGAFLRLDFQVHHGVSQRPATAVATSGVRFNLDGFRIRHLFPSQGR